MTFAWDDLGRLGLEKKAVYEIINLIPATNLSLIPPFPFLFEGMISAT